METNLTSIHEVAGLIPDLALLGWGSGIAVSCGVGHRCGSNPVFLWLWCRLAATALISPLAWKPPYAAGVALKTQKDRPTPEPQQRRIRATTATYTTAHGNAGSLTH